MRTKYSESPTNKIQKLAYNDDADACMELAQRYQKGTALLEKDMNMAAFWKQRAKELGYDIEMLSQPDSTSYGQTTNSDCGYQVLPNYALMSLAHNGDIKACLELATRFSEDIEKTEYWRNKAKELQKESCVDIYPEMEIKEKKYDWAITPDKSNHEYVIGIDFGHGETSAAFCPIGWNTPKGELGKVKDIDFGNNSKVIPSAISITSDNKAYIGEVAFSPEILKKAQVYVCFKKKPENISGEREQLMIRFMHEVYLKIREKAGAVFTDSNHFVYIATPSGWKEADMDLYGQMAAKAGIPIAGITWESRAAFIKAQQDVSSGLPQYISKGAVVFDMGSSTLDFTYMYVGNGLNKRIDYGYDCGASQVEKDIYEDIRVKNSEIIDFEKKHPNLIDNLLFEARCAKEKVYCNPTVRYKKTVNIEDIIDDEEFEDTKMKFVFQPGELNQMLKNKGYIEKIRKAMIDFRDNKIGGKKIEVAFLTGGASRMDFIVELIEDCWHLPPDLIYRDQDPSLTISQGIAEVGRIDSRSGGMGAVKQILYDINTQWDIYTPFTDSLIEIVTDEMTRTVRSCITEFRDYVVDLSINDLQVYIGKSIKENMAQMGDWAMNCYKRIFEEKTQEIRLKLDKIASDYSETKIQMHENHLSISSLPEIDLSVLTKQVQEVGSSFMENSSNLVQNIVIAAVGGVTAVLLNPLALLISGGYLLRKFLFGEKKTEEQKRQEALAKELDIDAREKVYNEFEKKWDSLCIEIHNSVTKSVRNNNQLRQTINSQSKETIIAYAKECIEQTRLMVE